MFCDFVCRCWKLALFLGCLASAGCLEAAGEGAVGGDEAGPEASFGDAHATDLAGPGDGFFVDLVDGRPEEPELCDADHRCEPGEVCSGLYDPPRCQVVPVPEGEACYVGWLDEVTDALGFAPAVLWCAPGLVCMPDRPGGARGTCRPLAEQGESCQETHCLPGLLCNEGTEPPTCRPPNASGQGEPCSTHGDCAVPLICNPGASPPGCQPPHTTGLDEPCGPALAPGYTTDGSTPARIDLSCAVGLRCNAGFEPPRCRPRWSAGEGEPCGDENQDCQLGLVCAGFDWGSGTCVLPGSLGEGSYCTIPPDCAAGLTCWPQDDGTRRCIAGFGVGVACATRWECGNGLACEPADGAAVCVERGDDCCEGGWCWCPEGSICQPETLACAPPGVDGDPCHADGDCAAPRVCVPKSFGSSQKVCMTPVAQGESCACLSGFPGPVCGRGQFCTGDGHAGTCQPARGEGEPCSCDPKPGWPCQPELSCEGQPATCQAKGGAGEPCENDGDCEPPHKCPATLGVCTAGYWGELGDPCYFDWHCGGGLACDHSDAWLLGPKGSKGICAPPRLSPDGRSCADEHFCRPGYRCDLETELCGPGYGPGGPCEADSDCGLGLACEAGQEGSRCSLLKPYGAACERDTQCDQPGRCVDSTCEPLALAAGGCEWGICPLGQWCGEADGDDACYQPGTVGEPCAPKPGYSCVVGSYCHEDPDGQEICVAKPTD